MEESIGALRAAVRLEPERAASHFELGNVLTQAGRLREARLAYRAALALEPDYADARLRLGRLAGDR